MGLPAELFGGRGPTRWRKVSDTVAGFLRADGKLAPIYAVIKGQIKELVRGSVEETLNELLEQEAEKLTQAARYERSEARQGYSSKALYHQCTCGR